MQTGGKSVVDRRRFVLVFEMSRSVLPLAMVIVCCAASGCGLPSGLLRSRWAMDNEAYASKYADGAEKSDLPGKIKQAADARFMEGASGMFVAGGVTSRPDANSELLGIEVGFEHYAASYVTTRGSLSFMSDGDDWFSGADVGLRFQTPTRLAPFAGAGLFAGYADEVVPAANDGIDNDDDGFTDERGEDRERFKGALAAVYPETGLHFWWTPRLRLTGYGRYMITTEGRDDDDWMIGGGLALFSQ